MNRPSHNPLASLPARYRNGVLAFAAALVSHCAQAQTPPAEFSLTGSIELPRLLDLCAANLKISVEYDPAALKGQTVTWRTPGGASASQIWTAANRLLAQRNFTTVRAAGSEAFTVVKLDDAAKMATNEPPVTLAAYRDARATGVRAGYRIVTIKLDHLSARDALEVAKPYLRATATGTAPTAAAAGSNTIVIADLTPRLDDAVDALIALDKPDQAGAIEEVALQFVTPGQALAQLKELVAKREAATGDKLSGEYLAAPSGSSLIVIAPKRAVPQWRSLIAQIDQREPSVTITYTPKLFSVRDIAPMIAQIAGPSSATSADGKTTTDDRFRVFVEEPTGSLIVTATPTQHAKIAEMIERLDNVPGEARRPVRTYVIRNRPINELKGVLDGMISAGVLESQTADSAGPRPMPAAAPTGITPAPLPGGANPMSSVNLPPPSVILPNAHGVSGRHPNRNATLAISLSADEATSTLIAVGDARLLDELGNLIRSLDVRQPQVMLEVILVSMNESDEVSLGTEIERLRVNGEITMQLASLFGAAPLTGAPPALVGPPGFTGAIMSPGEFSVVIHTLQKIKNGRSVSLPKVLVANNQNATFNSVIQQPFTSSFTAGNSSSPTVTFGGTQDAGTQITVKPQISEGGTLLLQYSVSVSSFEGASAQGLPPPRQLNSISSQSAIPDGYAVAVGGMDLTTSGNDVSQIPILGSIPFIGEFAKSRSVSQSRSKFYIFIRAGVMRDAGLEQLKNVSREQLRMADIPSGWPENEPQIIR